MNQSRRRDDILDLVRGISALIVLCAHIRGFLFVDIKEVHNPNLIQKGFYFATGVHHEAVMVFFVLSGYFVGGGVLKLLYKNGFAWHKYVAARLARLWIVLLPAIGLTVCLQLIGQILVPDAYDGAFYKAWMSGPRTDSADVSLPLSAIGNAFFLQTIAIPAMATNGPLWSLAYEFWYYVLFPLMAVPVALTIGSGKGSTSRSERLVASSFHVFCVLVLLLILPWDLSSKGAVWMLGVVVWELSRRGLLPTKHARLAWMAIGSLAFCGTLIATKLRILPESDYCVGAVFAVWMLSLLGNWNAWRWCVEVSRFLANFSFTLYVTHFPVVLFVVAVMCNGKQLQPDSSGALVYIGVLSISLFVAWIFWWLFEYRTDTIRRTVESWIENWRTSRRSRTS